MEYDLLFHWFLDLDIMEPSFNAAVLTKTASACWSTWLPSKTTDEDLCNPSTDYRGERRSNPAHRSATDPEAQLVRKGKDAPVRPGVEHGRARFRFTLDMTVPIYEWRPFCDIGSKIGTNWDSIFTQMGRELY